VRAAGAALAVALAAASARAATPPVVPWQDSGTHVGEVITVEGEVQSARIAGDTCILEFAAGDPDAFRAVLLLPLLSSGPPHPERLYPGRRVRVTGRVQRFRGRPEIVLRGPGQIEMAEAAGAAPAVEPPAPAPVPPPAPPVPVARTEDARRTQADAAPCERARGRWREAAAELGTRVAALERCLGAASYRCGAEGAALAPAVTTLESIERQVEAACR
jgi:hypothetical protein